MGCAPVQALATGSYMKRIALHWQILAALLLATLTAAAFRGIFPEGQQPDFIKGAIELCKLIGDLVLRALKMIIVSW